MGEGHVRARRDVGQLHVPVRVRHEHPRPPRQQERQQRSREALAAAHVHDHNAAPVLLVLDVPFVVVLFVVVAFVLLLADMCIAMAFALMPRAVTKIAVGMKSADFWKSLQINALEPQVVLQQDDVDFSQKLCASFITLATALTMLPAPKPVGADAGKNHCVCACTGGMSAEQPEDLLHHAVAAEVVPSSACHHCAIR